MKKLELIAKTALSAGLALTLVACVGGVEKPEGPDVNPITVPEKEPESGNENIEENIGDDEVAQNTDTEEDNNASESDNDYSEVIDRYAAYLADYENADFDDNISIGVSEICFYTEDPFSDVGYVLDDFSGDGKSELLIVEAAENEYTPATRILAVYGMDGDTPVLIQEGASRSRLFLTNDNKFYLEGSDGAASSGWKVFSLNEEGIEAIVEKCCYTHYLEDGSVNVYSNTTGSWTYDDSEICDMTDDEVYVEGENYLNNCQRLGISYFEGGMKEGEHNPDLLYVKFAEEVENDVSDYEEVDLSTTEHPVRIAIGSGDGLLDFRFYALTITEMSEDGLVFEKEELFNIGKNPMFFPVIVNIDIMGDLPQYGFSCRLEEEGDVHMYAIDFSGNDGSPYFFEIEE